MPCGAFPGRDSADVVGAAGQREALAAGPIEDEPPRLGAVDGAFDEALSLDVTLGAIARKT